jgi:hypothetical protein
MKSFLIAKMLLVPRSSTRGMGVVYMRLPYGEGEHPF